MSENKDVPTYEWKDIGVIGVDTGKIIIADPANVLTHREFEELREKEKIAKLSLYTDFKHGIVSKTGFGEGSYHAFAKIGDFGNMVKRITEIRIIFDAGTNNNDSQKIHDTSMKVVDNTPEKKDDLSKGVKL
ncbi:hypothetical protein [Candidatus Nitrosotalea bavarica]|uniref:hypothetical protein n=1 Tax=Candidatus Nitrosotalea bavarica TaxID=1903277 RepID=UPI000C70C27F|nr:hypothetical protein [Candidatus Nitrosotalea bavarica]